MPYSVVCSLQRSFLGGCKSTEYKSTERNPAQKDHSGVQLTASIPDWGSNNSTPEIVLTFANPTPQSRKVVLPCPMLEDYKHFATLDRPTLVLLCKSASFRDEIEVGFVQAKFGWGAISKRKVLTLEPGENVQVLYMLTSFYSCGHAGPQKSEGFLDVFQPGEHEVTVQAIIAYSDEDLDKGDRLESPSVVLKCDFPKWMFKREVGKKEPSSDKK